MHSYPQPQPPPPQPPYTGAGIDGPPPPNVLIPPERLPWLEPEGPLLLEPYGSLYPLLKGEFRAAVQASSLIHH